MMKKLWTAAAQTQRKKSQGRRNQTAIPLFSISPPTLEAFALSLDEIQLLGVAITDTGPRIAGLDTGQYADKAEFPPGGLRGRQVTPVHR